MSTNIEPAHTITMPAVAKNVKKAAPGHKKIASKSTSKKATSKKVRQPKAADAPFTVSDPTAMLRQHSIETQETIQDIADDKTIDRSTLANNLYHQLAYRLALLGLVDVDTLARNAKNRVYSKNGKTNMRSLKTVLAQ